MTLPPVAVMTGSGPFAVVDGRDRDARAGKGDAGEPRDAQPEAPGVGRERADACPAGQAQTALEAVLLEPGDGAAAAGAGSLRRVAHAAVSSPGPSPSSSSIARPQLGQ